MQGNKYIDFEEINLPNGKKEVYLANKKSGEILGEINYYSAWRQYTFKPYSDTVYSFDCLDTISQALKELNGGVIKWVGIISL